MPLRRRAQKPSKRLQKRCPTGPIGTKPCLHGPNYSWTKKILLRKAGVRAAPRAARNGRLADWAVVPWVHYRKIWQLGPRRKVYLLTPVVASKKANNGVVRSAL